MGDGYPRNNFCLIMVVFQKNGRDIYIGLMLQAFFIRKRKSGPEINREDRNDTT